MLRILPQRRTFSRDSVLALGVVHALCVATGCTTAPTMTEIHHTVDGQLADGSVPDATTALSETFDSPVRRAVGAVAHEPFAVTEEGREIERNLGVDR